MRLTPKSPSRPLILQLPRSQNTSGFNSSPCPPIRSRNSSIISHALFTQRTYQLIIKHAIHSPFSFSLRRAKSVVYFWVAALQRSLEPAEFVAWFARVFGPVIETAENPIKACVFNTVAIQPIDGSFIREARGPDDATKDVEAEQLPAKRQMVDSEAKYMKALDTFSQLCTVPSEAAAKAKPLRPRSSSSNVVARARNLKCSAVSTKPRFL
ncbi:hypothetical protein K438DRAFT_1878763 [Mycena galopus ATCC 62051]|nr:hypothetical protein K438DRAFT_1878763 [Mycena galopus ATCC 62051]